MFVISLLSGIGFSLFQYRGRRALLYSLASTLILSPILLLSPINMKYVLKDNLSFLLFQSPTFGLTLYFSAMIVNSAAKGFTSIEGFMGSGLTIVSMSLKLRAISMLASLATWFNTIYIPYNSQKQTLASLAHQYINVRSDTVLFALSLVLPILIILISVPVIGSVTYSKKE